jgi:tetratricopeptide (TPR) repeat protein
MRGTLLNSIVAGVLLLGGIVQGKPVSAQLGLGEGRSWKGQIVSRDGDWIEFSTGTSAKPIRIGISTIKELNFKVNVDTKKISALMADMDYDGAISSLEKSLAPFAEYRDIPSNVMRYNTILMELYYRNKQYDLLLEISRAVGSNDSHPAMQSNARVYTALALISSGKKDEALALRINFGWDKASTRDTSAGELYARAKLNLLSGELVKAQEDAAKVVAFHSQDTDWIQPSELLCAEIYAEMGMFDSAEEVCRQIMILYKNSPEAEEAGQLKERISGMRAGQ